MTTEGTDRFRSIVDNGTERVNGRNARQMNFFAGKALAETIRTTLGPKGSDKMLISSEGKVVVTNDGARVLDLMGVDHPAAETIVEVARNQDEHVGDGTTTAVVLVGELLARAESLLDRGVHGTTIATGYQLAARQAIELLETCAIEVAPADTDRLEEIAATVITGRWDTESVAFLSELAVEAALAVCRDGRLDRREITRKSFPGGRLRDSAVVDGLVIDLAESSTAVVTPDTDGLRRIENASIALIDDQLTIETIDGLRTVSLDGAEERRQLLSYEDGVYAGQVEAITGAGADVVFCQKGIDNAVRHSLADRGVLAVERTRRDEFIQLGRTTRATHVGAVSELTAADIGHAGVIERRIIGDRELAVVRDCEDTEQISLVLRGGSRHVVDELDRIMDDCLGVLELAIEERTVLPGGGATEVRLARELQAYAEGIGDREGLAIEAFAEALEVVPRTLARTAGLDPIDVLADLRSRHHDGETTIGLDLATEAGTIADVIERGILEPLAVKRRAIGGAEEAATILVRVDDVIAASRNESTTEDDEHDHDHGPGSLQSTEGYPWALGHSMGH